MVDQTGNGPSSRQSHLQGLTVELCPLNILHRPANNLPRGHIFDARQIKPALIRVDIGNIRQPNCVGRLAVEVLL